jgi:hypothetical protein
MDRCIYHDGLMGSTDGARSQNPGGKHHSALAIIVIIIVVVDNVVAPECLRYTAPGGEPLCNLAVIWVGSRRLPGSLHASQLYRLRLDPENEETAQDLTIRWVLKHLLRVDRPSRTKNDDDSCSHALPAPSSFKHH